MMRGGQVGQIFRRWEQRMVNPDELFVDADGAQLGRVSGGPLTASRQPVNVAYWHQPAM